MSTKAPTSISQSGEWRSHCPVSCALDVLGDKWTLLIVRDLIIHGSRTYSDFCESPEKISTNVLAARLKHLSKLRLIERVNPDGANRGNAYQLTKSGRALEPILQAYVEWAQTYLKEFNDSMKKV